MLLHGFPLGKATSGSRMATTKAMLLRTGHRRDVSGYDAVFPDLQSMLRFTCIRSVHIPRRLATSRNHYHGAGRLLRLWCPCFQPMAEVSPFRRCSP